MRIFLTSDTHFYSDRIRKIRNGENPKFQISPPKDGNMIKFTDVNEMNEFIIDHWNSMVNNDDLVFHLGDVGVVDGYEDSPGSEMMKSLINRLNGTKYLVLGNHDHGIDWISLGFNGVMEEFNSIPGFLFTHFPMFYREEWKTTGTINVHGHIHSSNIDFHGRDGYVPDITRISCNVSVEARNYYPIQLKDIYNACTSACIPK